MAPLLERVRFETVTALRSLAATPVPTIAAIVTLAVAAGVNLAMFGLIGRALLSPPAHVTAPERVFTVSFQVSDNPAQGRMTTTSAVTYAGIRDQVPALSGAAARSSPRGGSPPRPAPLSGPRPSRLCF